MAIEIVHEVFHHAPEQVRCGERLVLLALADAADQNTRMVWLGINELMRKTALGKSAVYEAVAKLLDRGILQEVAREAWPEEAKRCRSVVRRITTVDYWEEGCPAPLYTGADDPSSFGPEAGTNPNITSLVERSPSDSSLPSAAELQRKLEEIDRARQARKAQKAARRSRHAATGPWDEIKSAAQLLDDEETTAPADADLVDTGDDLLVGDRRPRRQRSGGSRRTYNPDSGMGLAEYFADRVRASRRKTGMDVANRTKLASHFNRWMAEYHTPPQVIRVMIDLYADNPAYHDPTVLPWLDFLRKRERLARDAERRALMLTHDQAQAQPAQQAPQDPEDFDLDAWRKAVRL